MKHLTRFRVYSVLALVLATGVMLYLWWNSSLWDSLLEPLLSWDVKFESVEVNGTERHYRILIPANDDGKPKPKPLLIVYHGFSGNDRRAAKNSQLDDLAREHDFFVVYPRGDSTWRFGPLYGETENPDVIFFDRLVETLPKKYHIDINRIYVAGMSKGGEFALLLSGERSEKIAAVVTQAALYSKLVEAERPFPLYIIVGTEDDNVSQEEIERLTNQYRKHGHIVKVERPQGIGHRWHVPLNESIWEFVSKFELSSGSK